MNLLLPLLLAFVPTYCVAFDASRRNMLLSLTTAAAPTTDSYLMCSSNRLLLREITIDVPDPSATVLFFTQALGMVPVRSESGELAVAYGPTELTRPSQFYPGVSTFDEDGGHCSIVVRKGGQGKAGDGLAYVQLAMPFIRASKLMAYGGQIVEAYGVVNVVAPGGLPLRLLVGDEVKDRIQYVALRVQSVKETQSFYVDNVGMKKSVYPRARPITKDESPFDPNPPKGSAYLEFCEDSPGLLLVPSAKDRFFRSTKPEIGDIYAGINVLSFSPPPPAEARRRLAQQDPNGNRVNIDYAQP